MQMKLYAQDQISKDSQGWLVSLLYYLDNEYYTARTAHWSKEFVSSVNDEPTLRVRPALH